MRKKRSISKHIGTTNRRIRSESCSHDPQLPPHNATADRMHLDRVPFRTTILPPSPKIAAFRIDNPSILHKFHTMIDLSNCAECRLARTDTSTSQTRTTAPTNRCTSLVEALWLEPHSCTKTLRTINCNGSIDLLQANNRMFGPHVKA